MWLRCWLASAVLLFACEAAPNRGTVCTASRDCNAPLVCRFGVCRDECHENRDCPSGASCLVGDDGLGACSLDRDLGCETGTGRECAMGLTCVGDRCVRTCESAADCPADGECRPVPGSTSSFCFDPRLPEMDAGPAIDDAGIDAAQSIEAGSDVGAPMVPLPPARDLCIGGGFICAIDTPSTEVHCWGDATYGSLGPGASADCVMLGTTRALATTAQPVQTATGALTGVDGIACGAEFACAHTTTGALWCWGRNDVGQLGSMTPPNCSPSAIPVVLTPAPDVASLLFASGSEACLFESGGRLRCWGRDHGIVGPSLASIPPTEVLAPFDAGARLATVAPGADFVCGLTAIGELVCWGNGFLGQTAALDPTDNPRPFGSIYAGQEHAMALHGTDDLFTWGSDHHHQQIADAHDLPDCDAGIPCRQTPVITYDHRLLNVATTGSARFSCAIRDDTSVDCWGENSSAESGSPSDASVNDLGDPVQTSPGTVLMGATAIYAGFENACARVGTELYCWGGSDRGQLQVAPADGGLDDSWLAVVVHP
jgi:alpha-tubulin suppressor-like RCC1 family protein